MARKKELSKEFSTFKSVKEFNRSQAKHSNDAQDISTLRRMPTDDLMGEEKEMNVRKSSRTKAVESVKHLTSTLSKKTLVHASSSLRRKKLQKSLTKVKARALTKGMDKLHTIAGLTSLGKSKMHQRASIKALTKQALPKETQSYAENDSSKTSLRPKKTLSKRTSSQTRQEKVSAELKGRNKFLWFPKDAILAVRTENDDFYLCRTRTNVYNYNKQVKVNWLVKKPKKYKIQNCYKLGYRDVIHPASVLMHVDMTRLSRVTFQLPNDQLKDIKKLLQIAIDVEKGEKTLDEVDDDVEQVMFIDPPAPKKPRIIKTASQKLRDKERLANKRKEPKEAKKKGEKKKTGENQGVPERKRKVPARKGVSLELHPRPDIKVLTHDPLFESSESTLYVSKTANSRLVYRAIYLKDNKLLRKLLKDGSFIYELYPKSLANEETPASAAGRAGDKAILLTLLEEYFGKKFADRRKNNRGDRHFLDKLGTGKYNRRSLGINFIRKIMASRGSREGNNAFTVEEDSVDYGEREFLKEFLRTSSNPELLETIEKYFETNKKDMFSDIFSNQDVHELLLQGHPDIAGKIIKVWLKHPYSRKTVHPLFRDVLLSTNEELTGCSPSNLSFVSRTINKLSVFHCAAANNNSKYLEKLLSIQPDVHIVDSKGNRPLHFAAACNSPDNVQLLLNMGGNFNDTNASRKLPLHIAIEANRPQNVKLLLEAAASNPGKDPFAFKFGTGGVNRPDNSSHSPLHIAAEKGFTEVAKILLKFGANVNAKFNVSKNQLTPLMSAAAQGNLKMVQLLVRYGADVEQKDRMERRAVIHACMNGATSVLSYLLNIGASPEHPDSSGNSPLHYASAYGWYFTVKLLLDAGVDPNANNMWKALTLCICLAAMCTTQALAMAHSVAKHMQKLTPLSVAYLKSQTGIVQLLLNYPNVDINFADDNGKTLLFHACESDLRQKDLLEQIKYIIENKKALCNLKDNSGQTPLHCLANNLVTVDDEEKANQSKIKEDAFKQSVAIAELLIMNECDPTVVDENNNTAAMVAISKVNNTPLCECLLQRGSPILPPASLVPTTTILHAIADSIWQAPENLSTILFLLENYHHFNTVLSMANYVDNVGFTPLQIACSQQGPVIHYENIEDRKQQKKKWDDVRAFIKILVEELDCDVNAKVQKRYFDIEDMPAPNSNLWWFSPETAGKTAAHLVMLRVDPEFDDEFNVIQPATSGQMFRDLVVYGTDLNVLDESGNSPLSTCILNDRSDLFEFMVTKGKCNFNMKVKVDEDEFVHPLILAATRFSSNRKKNADVICKLIECGCDLNCETSDTKKKILHLVAAEPEAQAREEVLKIVNKLAEKGYNFNSLDGKQRTALHYALKANNGGLNQSYELEVKLIQQGTNLGLKDKYGRTALNYIFKTTAPPTNNPFMVHRFNQGNRDAATNDPAELTKLIGRNMSVMDINERDKYGQTVLHQAAKQGATFCCMYLTLVGAAVNIEDNNRNTALSLAVQNKHDGCATTLIQAGANLKSKVFIVAQEDKSLKVEKNKLKEKNAERKSEEIPKEVWQWQPNTLIKVDEPIRILSLYQAAIEFDLPGVAMFVTEASQAKSGLTQADAISIALKSCKYNIAMRLLCTTTDKSVLHIRREHGQSLLHLLALSGADYKQKEDPVIVKIAEFLLNAGLSAAEGDEFNCNPMLYAVINRLFPLADILAEKSNGYDVNYTDNFHRSYLAAALWRCHSNKIDQACWDFIEKLSKHKMDINQFFDLPLNPDLATIVQSDKKKDPNYWQSYPNVKTTALFAAICCGEFTISYNLLVAGANPNLADGNSLTPLMYAVKLGLISQVRQLLNYEYDPLKSHDTEPKTKSTKKKNWSKRSRAVFKLKDTETESDDSSDSSEENMEVDETDKKKKIDGEYFTLKKTSSVNLNAKDRHGRTALHYVAQTHSNGTFDNEEAAFVLVKGGAKLTADATGINPYELALNSCALKVAEVIRKHFNLHQKKPSERVFKNEVLDKVPEEFETWPDFHEASEKVLRRYDSGHILQDVYLHEIDSNCNIKDGELLKDEQQNIYYDVLMTKVDVKQLDWGLYNFYQMQIVSQPRKSLFILFTRWGRIEDKGQFQHTPFSKKEEAVKEFVKIFQQKSGNKWTNVKNFEKKPYKYRLIEDAARKAPVPQKEVDFNLESNVPSRMPNYLHKLVETMMNPKAMQMSMKKPGKMELTLALGQLNKEILMKGKDLLDQIEKLVQQVENYRNSPKDEREESVYKDAFQNNLEKIAELSNEYFHVIPTKNFSCEKIRPLDQRQKLMTQIHNLSNLLDYEIASKMLLAAMHYRTVYNPVDYVYRSIGCKIQRMNQTDEMSQMILKYITISGSASKVHGIYKLKREGENERLAASKLDDHRLLWHGTNTCNLLSILNRGLVICPPEAQMTGWAYGKGIYFSDAFAKSASYIRTDGASSYMLLCEVALGKLLDYNKSKNEEDIEKKMQSNHNSVEVRHPFSYYRSSDWFYLPSGVCLPQGSMKDVVSHMYTQYVALDPAQVCLRYLVEFSQ